MSPVTIVIALITWVGTVIIAFLMGRAEQIAAHEYRARIARLNAVLDRPRPGVHVRIGPAAPGGELPSPPAADGQPTGPAEPRTGRHACTVAEDLARPVALAAPPPAPVSDDSFIRSLRDWGAGIEMRIGAGLWP